MSVFRDGLFHGRVAIVTGGATGIGLAITKELLHLGCNVVIAARKADRLRSVAGELNAQFPSTTERVLPVPVNIRKEEDVSAVMKKTLSVFGRLDYVVNNGGGQFPSPIADISLKGWNAVVETNLTGTFLMCKEAFNAHLRDNGGVIVNIIAEVSRGFPYMAHTGAARAGVDNLTKSMAVEWAQNGVRVNAIAPGIIYSSTAAANYGGDEMFNSRIKHIPAQRLGTVEEVSATACFLLSPAASFITGTTMTVDGGQRLYQKAQWDIPNHHKMPAFTGVDEVKSQL